MSDAVLRSTQGRIGILTVNNPPVNALAAAVRNGVKDGIEAFGNRVRVKVVKNKVAPPFKQAEFDIIYGDGISWEGTVLDTGLEKKVVQKSGSYFSFGDERLGQGRQNATAFLREHPDVVQGILRAIQNQAPPEQVISARLLPQGDVSDEATPVLDEEEATVAT
jgi:recombination protein RecA